MESGVEWSGMESGVEWTGMEWGVVIRPFHINSFS